MQARLQFLKICKKYPVLYKQHHCSPSTILTSESLAIETVSTVADLGGGGALGASAPPAEPILKIS